MALMTGEAEGVIKTDAMGRLRTSTARRERLLEEFDRSGLSGPKFAALVGVKYQTFATWIQKRRRSGNELARGIGGKARKRVRERAQHRRHGRCAGDAFAEVSEVNELDTLVHQRLHVELDAVFLQGVGDVIEEDEAEHDVMGGVSTSRFQILTNGTAVFSGVVSLENNGGFASVRSSPVRQNLSDTDAFVLRVRGDGRRYKFTARTETGFDAPNYQAEFTTKRGEWEEHRLAFTDFVPTFRGRVLTDVPPLNPAKIASVGFLISDQQEGPFRLEIDWVKATGRPN